VGMIPYPARWLHMSQIFSPGQRRNDRSEEER
jgi:hypothetical protein